MASAHAAACERDFEAMQAQRNVLQERLDAAIGIAADHATARQELEAEIAILREALMPFAKAWPLWKRELNNAGLDSNEVLLFGDDPNDPMRLDLSSEDFRNAAELLGIDDTPRTCRVCGCTDDHACDPPCWWVEDDLYSTCADLSDNGLKPIGRNTTGNE